MFFQFISRSHKRHFDLALANTHLLGYIGYGQHMPISLYKYAPRFVAQLLHETVQRIPKGDLVAEIRASLGDALLQLVERYRVLSPVPLLGEIAFKSVDRKLSGYISDERFEVLWLFGRYQRPDLGVCIVYDLGAILFILQYAAGYVRNSKRLWQNCIKNWRRGTSSCWRCRSRISNGKNWRRS